MRYRLGIDVGGTNTDAVLLNEQGRIVSMIKTPVTPDVIGGISHAVQRLLDRTRIPPQNITYAMLGTTQITNAIIERKGLTRVGIIRLGAPATRAIPPLVDWPADLREKVEGPYAVLPGGVEYDGRVISPFDPVAVRETVRSFRGRVQAFAVISVFAAVRDEDELATAEIIAEEVGPGTPVSLSHHIGSLGLLERENATILNAAVAPVARHIAVAFQEALKQLGIKARLFLSQNDGTLMALETALHYPILTIACGPTNSMRGAAFLSGLRDAIVIDVGGTSTDVGVLLSGFPRESALAVEIGGVRTNFRMPDLISIGLGGGSVVHVARDTSTIRIGPESVGYRLMQEALCFGGKTFTMTDVAVARGMAVLGKRNRVTIVPEVIERTFRQSITMLEQAIDRIKLSAQDVPVVAVGGGSILLPGRMIGISQVYRPKYFEVANAIGAAIAQVSGTIDHIFSLERQSREEAFQQARQAAIVEALKAGADPTMLSVIDVDEIPLAYLPGNAVRIKVKVAGNLSSKETRQ